MQQNQEVARFLRDFMALYKFNQVILDPEVLRMLLLSLAMIFMMLLRPAGLIPAHSRYSRPELVVGKPAPAEAAK